MDDKKPSWMTLFVIVGVILTCSLLLADVLVIDEQKTLGSIITSSYSINDSVKELNEDPIPVKRFHLSKWIVVTSVNAPTKDLKRLAAQPGWSVVVVADKKTPVDWNLEGVHFLSVERQLDLALQLPSLLPFETYTRKNVGYLYAIVNGAQWIYDTDDDNKPYGRGLDQFDYGDSVSGLRYRALGPSSSVSERLFNPYRFFGNIDMWPRGFPLEYIKDHTNGDDRYLLCREMRPAVVQQGLVHKDPDVDALYRLLHADSNTGLHERFNQFAPPIVLDAGTYAPWNSQNTLFHRNAFFTMFLPTTVEFRVTDIWRSFFSQKLLHLIGESVAFYPVNAIQIRNAHDFLDDFKDEKAVYLKAGSIVEFISWWDCSEDTVARCTVELARAFRDFGFIGALDVSLIEAWIVDLESIGYQFPPLAVNATNYVESEKDSRGGNCRRANLNLRTDQTTNYSQPQIKRAEDKVRDFGELLEWCDRSDNSTLKDTLLLSPHQLAVKHARMPALTDKLNSVLVLTNNWPWSRSIGILQRLYQPFFAMIIFCGTWSPKNYVHSEPVPAMRPGFNYVHLTEKEMFMGYFGYYCMAKVKELRLQNVQGYYFASDDAVFNIWQRNEMDSVTHPWGIDLNVGAVWWYGEYGLNGSLRVLDLVEEKYANDGKVQNLWNEFNNRLMANNYTNVSNHMTTYNGRSISDFYYVPQYEMEFFGGLAEIFAEGKFFLELAVSKMLFAAKKLTAPKNYDYMWPKQERDAWPQRYNSSLIMSHPIKFSRFANEKKQLQSFCSVIIATFKEQLYE